MARSDGRCTGTAAIGTLAMRIVLLLIVWAIIGLTLARWRD
ncbi:hypothetical protein [Candidatus Competibacter denitrificans]|nr:hypothetical protein [Candidatus Competibacter denitrificans]